MQAKQSEKPLTNKELFESEEYRDFTQKAAEDMVNGICGYLRRQGFHITEAQEDERVRSIKMDIHYAEDDMTTAFTDGAHIGINAGNKMLAPLKKQELRHFAVQGFRVHEIGHVIFSDFPTTQAWLHQLEKGEWWPVAPKGITTESGAALDKKLKQEHYYRQVLLQVAKGVENALEDGYIEREIQLLYGGLAATELATLNDLLLEDMKSFGEQLSDGVKPFFVMLNQLLLYAKFDMTMAEGCPEEYLPMLEECIFTIDEVMWKKSLDALERQGIMLQGVPGFYRKNGRYCAATFRSGFFIPYFDEKGRICGMQIRFDTVKESDKRYLWFSSAGYEDGCSARNITSYGAPSQMPVVDSGRLVFVTEGALKAAAANALDAKHHPIIAIGGVSCYGQWEETCRYLQSKNIRFVADAFDSDRETNASVQKSLEKLYSIAAQYGIRMQRCDWGTAQKGVDDFLLGAAVQTDDGVILSSLWDPRKFVPPVRYIKKNMPAMFKPPVKKPKIA